MTHSNRLASILFWCLLTCCMLTGAPAHAFMAVSSPTPATANAPLGASASYALLWNVRTSAGPFVRSVSGRYNADNPAGPLLGTTAGVIANNAPPIGVFFPIAESLQVPADVIYRAHKLGATTLVYTRTFQDGDGLPGEAFNHFYINITSSGAADFSITRMALSFGNGAAVRVIETKEKLLAEAEINFNGNGLLQAVWEVADPASTAGEPFFRPLSSVRQALVGTDKQTWTSPTLPTTSPGLYLVRLRVTEPAPGFVQPVIRYFVTSGAPGEQVPVVPLGLVAPANQSMLAAETKFAWQPIHAARVYQLELYEKPQVAGDNLPDLGMDVTTPPASLPKTPPLTGMLLANTQTQTLLPLAIRMRLIPGHTYLWRLLAINIDGRIVGESDVREMHVP